MLSYAIFFHRDANVFRHRRWLETPLVSLKVFGHVADEPGPQTYPAIHISKYTMYVALMRFIVDFRIAADDEAPSIQNRVHFGPDLEDLNKTPYPFNLPFTTRSDDASRRTFRGVLAET